jgi:hypothetical protein
MHGILRTPSLLGTPFVHLAIEIPILRTGDRTAFHSLLIQRIRLGKARLHLKSCQAVGLVSANLFQP